MIAFNACAIFKGVGCCQTFLPIARPAAPDFMTSETSLRNLEGSTWVPPAITTFVFPADLMIHLKSLGLPLYFILTMSAPSSKETRAAYANVSLLNSFLIDLPLGYIQTMTGRPLLWASRSICSKSENIFASYAEPI